MECNKLRYVGTRQQTTSAHRDDLPLIGHRVVGECQVKQETDNDHFTLLRGVKKMMK